ARCGSLSIWNRYGRGMARFGTALAFQGGTMARRIFRTPIRGRARVLLLCVAVVAEAAFAACLWESGKERPTHGYLMKVGPRFVVAWTRGDRHFDTTVYGSLEDAVRFAGEELGLTIGKHLWASPELEYLSLKDRFGTYVLHWKTFDSSFLNQLTF